MGKALGVLIWILVIGVVLLFMAHMFWQPTWWFPEAISEHGPTYDAQFMRTLWVVAIAFILAQVALGYVVFTFTSKKKGRAVYSHGSNKLEVTWTVITAAVFITVAVLGQRVWAELHFYEAPPDSVNIEVVAQQFGRKSHRHRRRGPRGQG